jgi:uncharacterized phage protein (TIGR01671 family)
MQVKFRGKRVDGHGWEYGNLRWISGSAYIETPQDSAISVFKESVGMWTGLKDKNGVDIYKGDVLVINAIRWEVLWSQYSLGFVLMPHSENGLAFDAAEEVFCVDCESDNDRRQEIEIVGNTTDNPELLKP